LSPERASDKAINSFLKSLCSLDAGFQAVFAERSATGEIKKGGVVARHMISFQGKKKNANNMISADGRKPGYIAGLLSLSELLAGECPKEPRYHRAPWPAAFFASMVRQAYILRANLNELEHALQGSDGTFDDLFSNFRDLPPFSGIKKDLMHTMEDLLHLTQDLLRNETGLSMKHLMEKMNALEGVDTLEDMPALIDEINGTLKFPDPLEPSMEDDLLCRINVVFMIFENVCECMAEMVKACIKEA